MFAPRPRSRSLSCSARTIPLESNRNQTGGSRSIRNQNRGSTHAPSFQSASGSYSQNLLATWAALPLPRLSSALLLAVKKHILFHPQLQLHGGPGWPLRSPRGRLVPGAAQVYDQRSTPASRELSRAPLVHLSLGCTIKPAGLCALIRARLKCAVVESVPLALTFPALYPRPLRTP